MSDVIEEDVISELVEEAPDLKYIMGLAANDLTRILESKYGRDLVQKYYKKYTVGTKLLKSS